MAGEGNPFGMMNESMGMPSDGTVNIPMPRMITPRDMQTMRQYSQMMRLSQLGGRGPRMAAPGRGMAAGYGGMDMSQGVDPSNMDMGQMNALLGQFGQHMPENPRINAVLPSTGFFGNHPRLAAGLESAMFGAASTAPAQTVGEGISNAMRGALSGVAERGRVLNQQYSAPFAQATMVANLQRGLHEDDALVQRGRLEKAQADYYDQRPDIEREKMQTESTIAANKAAAQQSAATTRLLMQQGKMDDTHASAFRELGIEPFPTGPDGNMGSPSKEDWGKVNKLLQDRAMQRSSVGPGISRAGADARQDSGQGFNADNEAYKAGLITEKTPPSVLKRTFGTTKPTPDQVDQYNRGRQQKFFNGRSAMPSQGGGDLLGEQIRKAAEDIVNSRKSTKSSGVKGNNLMPSNGQPASNSPASAPTGGGPWSFLGPLGHWAINGLNNTPSVISPNMQRPE